MDEQIKPVAWYAELHAPDFRDHGQKYGPEWPSNRDRLPAEQTTQLEGGVMTVNHQPLYSQQSIDALRAEVERLTGVLSKIALEEWQEGCGYCHPEGCESPAIARAAIDAARKGAEEVRYTITPKGREMLNGG